MFNDKADAHVVKINGRYLLYPKNYYTEFLYLTLEERETMLPIYYN